MSYIIGIDFGGMSAKAGIFCDGKFLAKKTAPTSMNDGVERTTAVMANLAKDLAKESGISFDDVVCIGIGSPGVIDSASGEVVFWGNYDWHHVPLGSLVSSLTGKPVFVTNDANAAALGEAKYGCGKQYGSSVLITLGTGVGGGVVIEGKLFEGYRSAGTEIGHSVIVKDGLPCGCGRKGCFEQYASARALVRQTREKMAQCPDSAMWEGLASLDDAGGKTAFAAAAKGDKAAQEVVDGYIDYLAEGIANIVNILRPEAIMVGGGVSNEGDRLIEPLKKAVDKKIFVSSDIVPLAVKKAELGNDAGIYGAAEYAVSRL